MVLLLAMVLAPAGAHARRLALAVGNDAYAANAPLSTAVNDAHALGDALAALGFEVTTGVNLGRAGMAAAMDQFVGNIAAGDVACVFFSGLGFERDGDTVLLPLDAPAMTGNANAAALTAGFSLDKFTDRIHARNANLVIALINSNRNDPFPITRSFLPLAKRLRTADSCSLQPATDKSSTSGFLPMMAMRILSSPACCSNISALPASR
jgi:uncharacterized caspase-like protein